MLKYRAAENPFRRDFRNADWGFSLVELIIVIAIMAILVAVLAPQFLKYVKQSRKTVDINNADEIAKVLNVAMVDVDDEEENTLFNRYITLRAKGEPANRCATLFFVHSPNATASSVQVELPNLAGNFFNGESFNGEALKNAIVHILNKGLGLAENKTNIQISNFEKNKLDMWIVCTDREKNLYIYTGAAHRELWINKSSIQPENRAEKSSWYMLYPSVSKEYEDL